MGKVVSKSVCPLIDCQVQLAHTELVHHFLKSHNTESILQLREISSGMRTTLCMFYRQITPGTDHCLAVLPYAGASRDDSNSTLPAVCGLCQEQADLPKCQQHLRLHLPVLVMVCTTTWQSLMHSEPVTDNDDKTEYLYLFWLLSTATTRPVVATLGIKNSRLEYVVPLKRLVRDFSTRMPIGQFLFGNEEYYILLRESQLDTPCDSVDMPTFLEVVIQGSQN